MKKIKDVLIELTPFFIAIIITTPLQLKTTGFTTEILMTLLYILILTSLFLIKYYQIQELKLFFLGVVCGIIVEGWGKILFLFSWQKFNSILPVPLYIPIAWGFAFIVMHRIGNIMIKK